ncbi:MAG: O-antigen ligase family protein [Lachnospiraceae bacterium]|nr:O-antigen ligase family protein [Lachnospiraceae bacterium]
MAQTKKKITYKTNAGSQHARQNKYKTVRFGDDSLKFKLLTLAPLAVIIAIVPLLVRAYAYDTGLYNYDFYYPSDPDGARLDFFLHCKMVAFLSLSIILVCILIAKLTVEKKSIKFSKIFIPLGIYGFLALLSSIFSKYQPYPWTGVFEQFESVFVLLGYIVTAYYAFLFVNDKKDIVILIAALTVGTLLMIPLGISQAFFKDFYQTELGYKLIMPNSLKQSIPLDQMVWPFGKGTVYLSLYNPNYVGSYAALLSPVFLMMVFAARNVILKIVYATMYVGLLLALFGSGSRAGFIGIGFSLILLVVLFARKSLRFWIPMILIAVLSIGSLSFYLKKTDSTLIQRLKEAFTIGEAVDSFPLSAIETNDDDVVLTWHDNRLHIQFDSEYFAFNVLDDTGTMLPATVDYDTSTLTITDERFNGITVTPVYLTEAKDMVGFSVRADGEWNFARYNNTYYYYTPYGKLIKYPANTATSGGWFAKHPAFASKRGFIWSKTLPLLPENFFLGTGADTFIFAFPQTDFLALKNGGFYATFMTKPHNMYMQVGVQTGVLSLIAMLAFYFMYLVICIRTSLKMKKHTFFSYISGGIAAGTFGYMITQLINDSTITVAPIYWALIGIGLSASLLAQKENDEIIKTL